MLSTILSLRHGCHSLFRLIQHCVQYLPWTMWYHFGAVSSTNGRGYCSPWSGPSFLSLPAQRADSMACRATTTNSESLAIIILPSANCWQSLCLPCCHRHQPIAARYYFQPPFPAANYRQSLYLHWSSPPSANSGSYYLHLNEVPAKPHSEPYPCSPACTLPYFYYLT